jgi:hypothetical protein
MIQMHIKIHKVHIKYINAYIQMVFTWSATEILTQRTWPTSSGVGSEICGNSSAGPTKVNICTVCTVCISHGTQLKLRDENPNDHMRDNKKLQSMTLLSDNK